MSFQTETLLMLGTVGMILLLIGAWASRQIKTSEDYWVGGRKLGKIVTACTQAATWVGGGMTVGWFGLGYKMGFGGAWYCIPQCLGLLIAAYLLVKPFRSARYTSLPDYFEVALKNSKIRPLVAIVTMLAPITWVSAQFIAAGRILEGTANIPFLYGVLGVGLVVIAYSVFGGYLAVVYTDTFQALLMFVLWLIVIPMPIKQAGGLGEIMRNTPSYMHDLLHVEGMIAGTIFIWIFMGVTESLGLQTTYQRIYSAKDDGTARFGLVSAAWITAIFGVIAPFVGMAIFTMNTNLQPDQAFAWFLANRVPSIVRVLYMTVVILATMSTADSMLNSVALNICHDFYRKLLRPNATERQLVRYGQIATAFFGFVSLYWATSGGWTLHFFGYAANLSSGPLVGVVLFTVLAKKIRNAFGVGVGLVSGVAMGVATMYMPGIKDVPAGGVIFSFTTAYVVAFIVCCLTRGGASPEGGAKDHETERRDEEGKDEASLGDLVVSVFAFWRTSPHR